MRLNFKVFIFICFFATSLAAPASFVPSYGSPHPYAAPAYHHPARPPTYHHPQVYHTAPAPTYHKVPAYHSPPTYHAPPVYHAKPAYHPPAKAVTYSDVPVKYTYTYAVDDDYSQARYNAQEQREGYNAAGSYEVSLPDGRVQKVTYTANEDGYVADVAYVGEAKYPEYQPNYPAAPAPTPVASYPSPPAPGYSPVPAPTTEASLAGSDTDTPAEEERSSEGGSRVNAIKIDLLAKDEVLSESEEEKSVSSKALTTEATNKSITEASFEASPVTEAASKDSPVTEASSEASQTSEATTNAPVTEKKVEVAEVEIVTEANPVTVAKVVADPTEDSEVVVTETSPAVEETSVTEETTAEAIAKEVTKEKEAMEVNTDKTEEPSEEVEEGSVETTTEGKEE